VQLAAFQFHSEFYMPVDLVNSWDVLVVQGTSRDLILWRMYPATTYKLAWIDGSSGNVGFGVGQYIGAAAGEVSTIRITDLSSPWTSDTSVMTNYIASPADNEVSTSEANAFIRFTLVAQAGVSQSIYFRTIDSSNTWRIDCDQVGGTFKLYSRVAGSDVEKDAGKTQVWVSGNSYIISIRFDGSKICTWVGSFIKHQVTSSDSLTGTGVKVSNAGSKLEIYPITFSGAAKTEIEKI